MTAIPILVQFVFRVTFGMALAMAATPSRVVTPGFYRVHLWVLMGLNTFASLALYSSLGGESEWTLRWAFGVAIGLVVLSYAGAVIWLYEQKRAGGVCLLLVMVGGAAGALLATRWDQISAPWMAVADAVTSGLMMGAILTAMLLGHWYLNTPSMQLMPIERLVKWSGIATGLRMAVCLLGAVWFVTSGQAANAATLLWTFVVFRWLAGLLGVALMIYMTWHTLKVPNTQSATGILYAAVILVFLGELISQMLMADAHLPM